MPNGRRGIPAHLRRRWFRSSAKRCRSVQRADRDSTVGLDSEIGKTSPATIGNGGPKTGRRQSDLALPASHRSSGNSISVRDDQILEDLQSQRTAPQAARTGPEGQDSRVDKAQQRATSRSGRAGQGSADDDDKGAARPRRRAEARGQASIHIQKERRLGDDADAQFDEAGRDHAARDHHLFHRSSNAPVTLRSPSRTSRSPNYDAVGRCRATPCPI